MSLYYISKYNPGIFHHRLRDDWEIQWTPNAKNLYTLECYDMSIIPVDETGNEYEGIKNDLPWTLKYCGNICQLNSESFTFEYERNDRVRKKIHMHHDLELLLYLSPIYFPEC
jgi:hypothetical protein